MAFFIEANLSSNDKIKVIKDALKVLSLEHGEVSFTLDKGFDIDDASTYSNKKAGDLAYALFSHLLKNSCLSQDEIGNLMDKSYSRGLFARLHYPVFSLVQDEFANGQTKRFYKDGIVINGIKYFISSQWFEEDRKSLIKYYIDHLK